MCYNHIMNYAKRSMGIEFNKEERKKFIDEIISYHLTEREEDIDIIAAGELLEFFTANLGVTLYNKAVMDTRDLLKKELEEIDYKLELLKK